MTYAAEVARLVSRYTPEDREALRVFQREHFGPNSRHIDDAFFHWLYERNPHRAPAGPTLWLCKRDGVVVAQQASIPFVLKVDDAEHRAAWLIDWMVHPDWRLKGVSPALFAANASTADIMLGLGLEDMAYRSVRRAGWLDAARLSLFVRAFDPDACAKLLKLPELLGKLVPRAILAGSAYVAGRLAAGMSGVALEPVAAFDERIDVLWRTAKQDYRVVARRDFAAVRWRFDEGPHQRLFDRWYLKRRDAVIGYAVTRTAVWKGYRIARFVDCFAERHALAPLMALVLEELSRKDVVAAFFEHWHREAGVILRSLGCAHARPSHRLMFKLRGEEMALASVLGEAASWFVMPADSDFDHILANSDG